MNKTDETRPNNAAQDTLRDPGRGRSPDRTRMMNTTDRMAIVGAPVGAVIGTLLAMGHGFWLGVVGAALGLVIGFVAFPLSMILRDIVLPPKVPLSGGKRMRIWSRTKPKANPTSEGIRRPADGSPKPSM